MGVPLHLGFSAVRQAGQGRGGILPDCKPNHLRVTKPYPNKNNLLPTCSYWGMPVPVCVCQRHMKGPRVPHLREGGCSRWGPGEGGGGCSGL